ncbi:MAG: hypothetical protein QW083_04135, partial [Methanomassiliicoccales archaeon]
IEFGADDYRCSSSVDLAGRQTIRKTQMNERLAPGRPVPAYQVPAPSQLDVHSTRAAFLRLIHPLRRVGAILEVSGMVYPG